VKTEMLEFRIRGASVPGEVFGGRTDSHVIMEMQRLAMESSERVSMRRGFRETAEAILMRKCTPFGIADQSPASNIQWASGRADPARSADSTVAGIVVAADGVLVDVGGLDHGAGFRVDK
jgi:hypothetical protein